MIDHERRIAELQARIKDARNRHGEVARLERILRDTRTAQLRAENQAKADETAQWNYDKHTFFGVRAR